MKFLTAALLAIAVAPTANLRAEASAFFKETRLAMGTQLEISLCGTYATKVLLEKSFELVDDLENSFSNYKSDSEISKLNSSPSQTAFHLSNELFELIRISQILSKQTQGAFDITVGPYLEIWNNASRTNKLPSKSTLDEIKNCVGSDKLKLNELESTVSLETSCLKIDTGGIGKGFAVDEIVKFLKKSNVNCALINFGHSSIYAIGHPPDAASWNLKVQFPEQSEAIGIISLKDLALSASGSHGGSIIIAGNEYGKLIDPRNGEASFKKLKSVVLHESATYAEALSKAVILDGAKALLESKALGNFEYLLIDQNGQKSSSPGFKLLLTSQIPY